MKALRAASRLLMIAALAACADGNSGSSDITAPPVTPGFSNGSSGSNHHNRPNRRDLQVLAKYTRSNRDPESIGLIGPEGGTVRAGDYEIIVPAGAVAKWSVFHIKLPNGGGRGTRAYAEFTSSRPFVKPVTIILPQDITTATEQSTILWWNDEQSTWESMPTTPTGDGRLQTKTPHFSIYGVSKGRGWIDLGG